MCSTRHSRRINERKKKPEKQKLYSPMINERDEKNTNYLAFSIILCREDGTCGKMIVSSLSSIMFCCIPHLPLSPRNRIYKKSTRYCHWITLAVWRLSFSTSFFFFATFILFLRAINTFLMCRCYCRFFTTRRACGSKETRNWIPNSLEICVYFLYVFFLCLFCLHCFSCIHFVHCI